MKPQAATGEPPEHRIHKVTGEMRRLESEHAARMMELRAELTQAQRDLAQNPIVPPTFADRPGRQTMHQAAGNRPTQRPTKETSIDYASWLAAKESGDEELASRILQEAIGF